MIDVICTLERWAAGDVSELPPAMQAKPESDGVDVSLTRYQQRRLQGWIRGNHYSAASWVSPLNKPPL